MAGYKSTSFDPDAIATASDAASSALAAVAGASDAASNALSVANIVSDAASKATVKAQAASGALLSHLAGKAGGQTVIGGTGVTDALKLQGTSANGTLTSPAIQLLVGNAGATVGMTVLNNGNVGIGITAPTAVLHLKAGTSAAFTAPLKLTSGVNLDSPEEGAMEYNGTHLYFTAGVTRYQLDQQSASQVPGQLYLSAAGGWPSTTNGCAEPAKKEYTANGLDLWNLAFDSATDENGQWTIVMPSDWDASTVTAAFYWTCTAGSAAQTVKFYCQGRSIANDDPIDGSWGAAVGVADTWIANGDLHISNATAAITIGGAGASELVQFRVYRDVSEDDLTGDALLLGVMITFTRT